MTKKYPLKIYIFRGYFNTNLTGDLIQFLINYSVSGPAALPIRYSKKNTPAAINITTAMM